MKIKYVLNVNESAPDGTMFSGMLVEEPIRDYAVVSNVYSGWVDDVQEHMGDNYSFKEWNTERDGSGTAYHAGDKLYESTTLYTVWNGETLMPETMEILKGDKRYWFNVLTNSERTKISNALTLPSVREYDVVDYSDWAEWESGNSYEVGDRVKYTYTIVHTYVKGWICIVANSSDTLETTEWKQVTRFPTPGEKDVLYIAKLENKAYYWDVDEEEYVCVGSLPTVTSSDNGKVLEVVNGEWNVGEKKIDKKYKISFGSNWSAKTWVGSTNVSGMYIWSDGENIYYSNTSTQYVFDKSTSTWFTKAWTGLSNFSGNNVWTDGDNIYYSNDSSHYVLNKATSTWSPKTWNGLTSIIGYYIWTDGDNIYYSFNSSHYVLNKSTSTWSVKEWNGYTDFSGANIWIDGDSIYFSSGSKQYILDKSTSTWSDKEWTGLTNFDGNKLWTDGENVYYSLNSNNYVLNKSTSTWSSKTWTGLTNFDGSYIWTDGENIYYSSYSIYTSVSNQYVLDKDDSPKLLLGTNCEFTVVNIDEVIPDISNKADLVDGKVPSSQLPSYVDDVLEYSSISQFPAEGESGKIYVDTSTNITYRWSGSTYVAIGSDLALGETSSTAYRGDRGKAAYDAAVVNVDSTPTTNSTHLITSGGVKAALPGTMTGATSSAAGTSGLVPAPSVGDEEKFLKGDGTWDNVDALPVVTSSDNGKVLEVNNGEWTIGSEKIDKKYDIHFSSNWSIKTWNGLTDFSGSSIWTDGDNIYYSKSSFSVSDQYVLDKSTSTWSSMTWNGFSDISGYYIWTDGDDIYLSNGSSIQYVLDKSTSTWSAKTWNGLTTFNGRQIWTDGNNIYCAGYYSYILDKSTSTWSLKEWNGLENVYYAGIWTDGDNIYYSYGANHYILDKSTSTWSAKTWNGLTNFYGEHVWTNNNNIYYSYNSNQYILDKSTSTWSVKEWTGLTTFNESYIWTDGENIYCSNGSTQYALDKDNSPKLLLGINGEFSPVGASEILPSDMTGASSSAAGTAGLVPAPSSGDQDKFLKGDGTWGEVNTSSSTVSKVSFTIATTDWTQSSNTYVADVTDSHITSTTEELIMYTNSVKNLTSDIDTNKDGTNNKITFIVDSVPTGAISGSIYIISQGNIVADTKVDIDQGVENAGKFLVVNSQGNVEPVTMQAWQGGSY